MPCRYHHREYTISIICITVVFLFADQNLLAPNLTLIANEFGFTNAERDDLLGGKIAIGFFIIGGFISIVAGYLADTVNRIILFAIVVFIGESACLATYWSTTYNQLYICRVFTGISIGGATPIVFSLLADLYESESRTKVSTLVGIAMSSGIALGQMMAGFLGPKYGWRLPFILVAAPALFFAVLILLTGAEPHRGSQEEEVRLLQSEINTNINMANQYMTSTSTPPLCARQQSVKSPTSHPIMVSTWADPETQTTETTITSCATHNPLHNNSHQNNHMSQFDNDTNGDTANAISVPSVLINTLRHNEYTLSQSRDSVTTSTSSQHHRINSSHHSPRHCYNAATNLGASTAGTTHHPLLPQPSSEMQVHYSEKIDCAKICNLFTNKSAVLVFMQGVPACLPWGMVYTFLNDYFSADKHLSVMSATIALTMFGFGGLFGQLGGGLLGQQLYNIDKRYQCVLMGGTTILSTFPMLYLLNTNTPGDGLFYIVAILSGFLVSMNGPNVRAVLQNVCTPETRGSAFALFNLTDDIGKGAGPWLVVQLIKACGQDRKTAFNIVTCFWVVGGLVLLLLVCTVEEDERIVQSKVRESLLRTHQLLSGQNLAAVEGGGDGTIWTSYTLDTANASEGYGDKGNEIGRTDEYKDFPGSGISGSSDSKNDYMSCSTSGGDYAGIRKSIHQQPLPMIMQCSLPTSLRLSQAKSQSYDLQSRCPMCGGIKPTRITTTYSTSTRNRRHILSSSYSSASSSKSAKKSLSSSSSSIPSCIEKGESTTITSSSSSSSSVEAASDMVCMCAHFPSYCSSPLVYSSSQSHTPSPVPAMAVRSAENENEHSPLLPTVATATNNDNNYDESKYGTNSVETKNVTVENDHNNAIYNNDSNNISSATSCYTAGSHARSSISSPIDNTTPDTATSVPTNVESSTPETLHHIIDSSSGNNNKTGDSEGIVSTNDTVNSNG